MLSLVLWQMYTFLVDHEKMNDNDEVLNNRRVKWNKLI